MPSSRVSNLAIAAILVFSIVKSFDGNAHIPSGTSTWGDAYLQADSGEVYGFTSPVSRCNSPEPFTPLSYFSHPDVVGGSWLIYDQNWSYLDFSPNSQALGFQNWLYTDSQSVIYFVHVLGLPPCPLQIDTLIVNTYPTLDLGPDQSYTFCQSEGIINLYDLLLPGTDTSGTWSLEPLDIAFPGGLLDLNAYADETYIEMTYTLTGVDEVCSDQAIYTLNIISSTEIILPVVSVCAGTSVNLQSLLPATVPAGGFWTGPGFLSFPFFTAGVEHIGTYVYTYLNNCGVGSVSIPLTVVNNFEAGPNVSLDICGVGQFISLNSLLSPSAMPGGIWIGGSTITLEANNSGVYTYLLSSPSCGTDSAFYNLNISNGVAISNITTVCTDIGFYVVNFQISGGQPPYAVNGAPYFGSIYTSAPIPFGSPYVFEITGSGACPNAVIMGSSPNCVCTTSASFSSSDAVLCGAQTVQVGVITTGLPPFELTYAINGIPTTVVGMPTNPVLSFNISEDTNIQLLAISDASCTGIAAGSINFSIDENPSTTDLGIVQTISYCQETPVPLSNLLAPSNSLPMGATWTDPAGNELQNGILDPAIDPEGVYTAFFANNLGCPYSQSVELYFDGGIAQNGSATVCGAAGNICPFELLEAANSLEALYGGGQWILYNANYQFLTFSGDWDNCEWSNTFQNIVDTTTFHFVYLLGTAPCTLVSDTLTLHVTPQVDLGIQVFESFCSDNSQLDLNTLLPGDIVPDWGWLSDSTITLNPDMSGLYLYHADNGCGNDFHQFFLSITPPPSIENSSIICLSDPTLFQLYLNITPSIPPYFVNIEGDLVGISFTSANLPVADSVIVWLSDSGPCSAQQFIFAANDSDDDGVCDEGEITGCQDPIALNYNPLATDPGPCTYGFTGLVTAFVSNNDPPVTMIIPNGTDHFEIDFGLSPNPWRNGNVRIDFDEAIQDRISIRIYDLSSKLLFETILAGKDTRQFTLELPQSLANGIYILQISEGANSGFERLMIAR